MKQRIELLDLWRSLAVCVMVVFHALYDLELFGVLPAGTMRTPAADAFRWFGAGSFILISGAVLRFSRDPVRRGFFVFCAGLAVAIVTALLKMPVKFGILQCIGVCMMLCGALRKQIEQRQGIVFALASLALFALTLWATNAIKVNIRYIYPLGFHTADFYSADYYPVLPWMFLYLIGTSLGQILEKNRELPALQRRFPRWMTFPGRHSLLIYLLHQPVLYGLTWLICG